MTQERISELKDKSIEIIQSEEQRGKKMGIKKWEWNHRNLGDSNERSNILALGKGGGERRKTLVMKNFPNEVKTINLQIKAAQQILTSINSKKEIPTHIIMKLLKTVKISKATRVQRHNANRETII